MDCLLLYFQSKNRKNFLSRLATSRVRSFPQTAKAIVDLITFRNFKIFCRTKVSPDVEKLDFDTRQKLFNEEKLKLTNDYLHFADESSDPESITANWINGFSSLFEEDSNTIPAVSLSTNSVSFGQCIPDGTINAMPIQVTNHTEGEIIAQWYQAKVIIFYIIL